MRDGNRTVRTGTGSGPPKVSVVMPAYSAEQFLDTAVESVVHQSLADWELVAVDDNSPDGTASKLNGWADRDDRIRVHANPLRRGVTGNWNECLRRATGEYVVKLDADDAFRPRALELLVDAASPDGRVGAGIRALVCDGALEPLGGYPSDEPLRRAGLDPYADHVLSCRRWYELAIEGIQLWNGDAFMARRSLLLEMGGLDETFGCPSDTDLLIRLLERDGSFAHVGYPGLLYRRHEGSTSDVARRTEGLAWEGQVLLLASLARARRGRRLTRSEARRYVRLWDGWQRYGEIAEGKRAIPGERFEKLSTLFAGIEPPPLTDRILVRGRDWLSSRMG